MSNASNSSTHSLPHHAMRKPSFPHVHHGYNAIDDEQESSVQGEAVWTKDTAHATTVTGTVFNIITSLVGVGIVGLPVAMAQAGWIGGMLMLVIATCLAMYCGKRLSLCMNDGVPGHQFGTYVELGEYCGGTVGKWLGFYASFGGCLGGSIFFVISAAEQFETLFPRALPYNTWALIFGLFTVPVCMYKTLGHVGAVSALGAATSAIVMLLVVAVVWDEKLEGHTVDVPNHTELFHGNPLDMSYAFVKIIFAFGGMCVFPEINRCMKQPSKFPLAIYISCGSTFIFYVLLMCSTYGVYGDYILSDPAYANVIKMLPNNWTAKVMALSMLAHVYAAFVVNMNPIFRGIEIALNSDGSDKEILYRGGLRTVQVLFTVGVAIAVPFFGDVLSLIGASMDSLSGCILPAWFYLVLFYQRDLVSTPEAMAQGEVDLKYLSMEQDDTKQLLDTDMRPSADSIKRHTEARPQLAEVILNVVIFVFMTLVAILGTYQSISSIISKS
ncbi:hypothetical protein SARC_04946 [Sphaeroforma arctica JP610]|uniref:Amino acid transporter transmembrane domain-containing protein n=1 Tax=Sphaeroforma arctica JP610 TaxID=667725 RepID=A0A0L0G112_9EUKA|nr:hypothetical protein SARC_04946 [Sphaeroforma arctica JP610]KNC82770.1 hypothetical protein SARC_04946 [Sphaeroforma arctica JP610]|eukprot:XP_014156672.1 hypothetical protein SARC_04946 [Sphaeroforma arctica JP610]